MRIRLIAPSLLTAALLFMAGCDRGENGTFSSETDEPDYRQGQQLGKQGRTQEALASYLKVIARRGDSSPESHLETGLIYLQNIKDPLAAIYHFRKYLELQPNSRQAVYVKGLVDTAKREFARTLPAQPLENQAERLDLLEQISRYQRENEQLKAELAALRAGGALPTITTRATLPDAAADDNRPRTFAPPQISTEESPVTLASEPAKPIATGPEPQSSSARTHTVQKGDTLYRLSIKYYGNGSKVNAIYEANRDVLANSSASLRIGAELKIP